LSNCTVLTVTLLFTSGSSGFLRVMFSTASIQTHPGQSVTMWCSHNIHVSGNLYWFKQSDGAVPITIVHMLYTESRQKVEPNYFNNFTKDHLVMDQYSKNTSLTIKKVNISDSGFYFCGATGYPMKFGNGTRLEVKGNVLFIARICCCVFLKPKNQKKPDDILRIQLLYTLILLEK
uniref:Novel immune-type receptor 10a n=1 Tax=Cyprinus carpio TaxID=7962 RepID=A0A8C2JX45_CYPCA